MGEDTLQVELPKTTGEASGSKGPRQRARWPRLHERIGGLRPAQDPELDRHRRLLDAVRQYPMQDLGAGIEPALQFANVFQRVHPAPEVPDVPLPQPRPGIPPLHPVRAGQHQQEVHQVPQQRGEDPPHHEDNWAHRRRLLQQQRVLAGKFAGNNLRNPRPAALPDDPTHPILRLQGNRAGGVRMDPVDRGRVDQWRRGVPGTAKDEATL